MSGHVIDHEVWLEGCYWAICACGWHGRWEDFAGHSVPEGRRSSVPDPSLGSLDTGGTSAVRSVVEQGECVSVPQGTASPSLGKSDTEPSADDGCDEPEGQSRCY